jgi:uncharacterized glyoxalase superfamily protein PhnB
VEIRQKSTIIQPYLFFGGRDQEALEFYREAIGVHVATLILYKDSPYFSRAIDAAFNTR